MKPILEFCYWSFGIPLLDLRNVQYLLHVLLQQRIRRDQLLAMIIGPDFDEIGQIKVSPGQTVAHSVTFLATHFLDEVLKSGEIEGKVDLNHLLLEYFLLDGVAFSDVWSPH